MNCAKVHVWMLYIYTFPSSHPVARNLPSALNLTQLAVLRSRMRVSDVNNHWMKETVEI